MIPIIVGGVIGAVFYTAVCRFMAAYVTRDVRALQNNTYVTWIETPESFFRVVFWPIWPVLALLVKLGTKLAVGPYTLGERWWVKRHEAYLIQEELAQKEHNAKYPSLSQMMAAYQHAAAASFQTYNQTNTTTTDDGSDGG